MSATALKFQVGARTIGSIRRRLVRVPVTLAQAIAGGVPRLPLLADADGYLVTSLPSAAEAALMRAAPALIGHVRQRYVRYHADLTLGLDGYLAQMSASTRTGLKRKSRRLAAASGATVRIERFASAAELDRFHVGARTISALTYQERLLGGGLPADAGFVARMRTAADGDRVRAWLLSIGDQPVAYLYCEAGDGVLRYDHVGHDPAFSALSPGSVLMLEAISDLQRERRFARFDFTEGEGQHKRQFATGGIECLDLLLLRPTFANRASVTALAGFDRLLAHAKRVATAPALKGLAKRVRRAS